MHRSILVTGGAGFIGSNMVTYLASRFPDTHITVVDSLVHPIGFNNIPSEIIQEKHIRTIEGSVNNSELMTSLVEQSDIIVHLAVEAASTEKFIDVQLKGTQTLLEALRLTNSSKLIFLSTCDIYGKNNSSNLKEDDPIMPTTLYAATKLGAEALVTAYHHTFGIPTVVFRPVSIYGPRQYPAWLISRFIVLALKGEVLPIMGDGSFKRDWIYVDEICRAITTAIGKFDELDGQIFNIGTGKEITVIEIAEAILSILKKPPSLIRYVESRPGDFSRQITFADKAKSMLGWESEIGFYEGLNRTIQWYKDNANWIDVQLS